MKKKTTKIIIATTKVTSITATLIAAFIIGKSQAKTETQIIEPSRKNYINIDTFEDFYTTETEEGTELHFYANGNEYIFEK